MHYANGREAKPGDRAVGLWPNWESVGVLHTLIPGSATCNATITPINSQSTTVNLKDCLHVDDIRAAVAKGLITDTSSGDQSPVTGCCSQAASNPEPGPHPEVEPPKAA